VTPIPAEVEAPAAELHQLHQLPDAHTQKVANIGVNSVPMVTNHDNDDAYTDADDTIVVENSTNDGCR